MEIQNLLEQREHLQLSPKAAFSDESRGRLYPEEAWESDVRTAFQRDTDRIVHCKSFRRLMHKTQVFLAPEGDHFRTRLTHTIEVSQIARTIARSLNLNEDLTEAIALGHDLGHTPFGHAGEFALSEMLGKPFRHNEQSLRVVDVLENHGNGLNLSYEVRMGILGHTGDRIPIDHGPVDGGGATVFGQQRGMHIDATLRREFQDLLGQDTAIGSHHDEFGVELLELFQSGTVLDGHGLEHRDVV